MRFLLALLLVVSGKTLLAAADLADLQQTARSLREVKAALVTSRGATKELTTFKHQLREWIESGFARAHSPEDIAKAINTDLRQAGLTASGERTFDDYPFGYVDDVELSHPNGWPQALLLKTSVTIPCGTDDSVYLYDPAGHRVFESERNDYQHNYAPQIISEVAVTRAEDGTRLVATVGMNPQCSSRFEYIYYRMFRIGSQQTVTLLDEGRPMDLNHEPNFTLRLQRRTFAIEFGEPSSGRTVIVTHAIEGNMTRRIDPVATQPQDFVLEWIDRPWSEMASRSSPAAQAVLKQWHSQLSGKFILPTTTHTLCRNKSQWEIGVGSDAAPPTHFFRVEERPQHRFVMLTVSDREQPGCSAN